MTVMENVKVLNHELSRFELFDINSALKLQASELRRIFKGCEDEFPDMFNRINRLEDTASKIMNIIDDTRDMPFSPGFEYIKVLRD